MKKCLLILILLVSSTVHLYSDTDQVGFVISPGVKLGYTFGEKGGFTFGLETSFIVMHTNDYIKSNQNNLLCPSLWEYGGLVVGIDWIGDIWKANINMEVGKVPWGLGFGAAFINENGKMDIGININPYYSLFLTTYYNYTIRFNNHPDLHEAGGGLKIPCPAYPPDLFRGRIG